MRASRNRQRFYFHLFLLLRRYWPHVFFCAIIFWLIDGTIWAPEEPHRSVDIEYLRKVVPLVLHRTWVNADTETGLQCYLPSSKCIHIVLAATGVYLKPLLACMNSIKMHTSRSIYFHVLVSAGESQILGSHLSKLFTDTPVEIVEFNGERVAPLIRVWKGMNRHSSHLNHARLYLPQIFPSLSTVMYLDPDTIVVADVSLLLDEYLARREENKYIAAVVSKKKDMFSSTYEFLVNCADEEVRQTVTNPNSKYFNAGVLVTDLNMWRRDGITEKLEHWLTLNVQRKLWNWGSQAPLALVFYDKWVEVDPSWNERRMKYYNLTEFEKLAPIVKVYHFAGEVKPWKNNGQMMWHLWCKYYPSSTEYWFCKEGAILNLVPTSPFDYSFVRSFWQSSKLL